VALGADGDREFSFARKPGADTCINWDEVDQSLLSSSRVFHIGSLSMTDEPARTTTLQALELAKNSGAFISYDPNYRPSLWRDAETARESMRALLPFVDIIKVADNEIGLLTGSDDAEEAASLLLAGGVSLVAVTLGAQGAYLASRDAGCHIEGLDVEAIDTTGAGDAFCGGMLYRLLSRPYSINQLDRDALWDIGVFANATAALCVQKRGAIPAMPTIQQTLALLEDERR